MGDFTIVISQVPVNTEELELAWDVVQRFLYTDKSMKDTVKNDNQSLFTAGKGTYYIYYSLLSFIFSYVFRFTYLFFLESATDNHSLWVFAETKQNPLKVAGYKPNFSQQIFEDFLVVSYLVL